MASLPDPDDVWPRTIVLIPARLAATRLPGKPLADIAGRPMIAWVLDVAVAAGLGPVAVAADDPLIVAAVEAAGGRGVLVADDVPSGTDRIRLALDRIDPERRYDRVVNLQGDLPTLAPADLAAVVLPLREPAVDIGTLAAASDDPAERAANSVVKAVLALDPADPRQGRALYFTRAAAPTGPGPIWHHIGVYAYRREALERFCALPPSPLERRERLEQLRALEAGMTVGVRLVDHAPAGVDTPADLERARRQLAVRGGRA